MRGKVAGMAEMTLEGVDARPEDSAFALGRVHSIETMGTVDGPGIRFVVFVQGCPMRCAYCHNPDTWSVSGGTMVTVEHLMDEFQSNHEFYRSGGITVSGGEPLLQPEFLADLFRAMHNNPDGRVHTCLGQLRICVRPRRIPRSSMPFSARPTWCCSTSNMPIRLSIKS